MQTRRVLRIPTYAPPECVKNISSLNNQLAQASKIMTCLRQKIVNSLAKEGLSCNLENVYELQDLSKLNSSLKACMSKLQTRKRDEILSLLSKFKMSLIALQNSRNKPAYLKAGTRKVTRKYRKHY